MLPRLLRLHPKTFRGLIRLSKEAEQEGAYRVAKRLQAVVLSNRHWLEVYQLPPYSPELNPTERLWQYTRKNGTHDRCFASQNELLATLTRVFEDTQSYPELNRFRLLPFGYNRAPLFMRGRIVSAHYTSSDGLGIRMGTHFLPRGRLPVHGGLECAKEGIRFGEPKFAP